MINFNCVVLCAIVLITARITSALTDDEKSNIHVYFDQILSSCGDEFGISQKEIMASKKENNANLNACFYACTLKKLNTINDQGLFEPAVAKAFHKKYIHGKDDLAKLDAITDTCSSVVNSHAVSDGVQGCERAKLLIQCLIDNKNNAVTDEEKSTIRADLEPLSSSCGDEFGISKEDVLASKKEKIANLNPCFYACVLKKIGILNDQGLFEPAASKAMHKKYIHNQDDRKELDAITDTCTSANDQAVSDDTRGCERAKALVQCFIDNTANFPLMSV